MDSRSVTPWADLPEGVVEKIGSCVGSTQIDVLRLRAVCTTWRSAIPPFKNSVSLPLKLQVPIIPNDTDNFGLNPEFYLIESTVYLIQPIDDGASINTNKPSSSRSGWLVKFMQTVDGKLRLVNPLCHKTINVMPEDMPNKVLNLLDLRVSQVCKSYHVQFFDPSVPCFPAANHDVGHLVSKILLISTSHNFSLMAIHDYEGDLCHFKSGDEKWTTLRDLSRKSIVDIIVYKGNFYAVDEDSETIKFDSSLNETKVASRLHNMEGEPVKNRLVESSGQLFLVDEMYLNDFGFGFNNNTKIKLYRLDEEKHEWTYVHTLDDRMFFAGDDCCFSVSPKDFGDQRRGNCIYYANGSVSMDIFREYGHYLHCGYNPFSPIYDSESESDDLSEDLVHKYKGLRGHNMGVFTIKYGKLESLLSLLYYADIFWPPPSWLNRPSGSGN